MFFLNRIKGSFQNLLLGAVFSSSNFCICRELYGVEVRKGNNVLSSNRNHSKLSTVRGKACGGTLTLSSYTLC